MIFAFSFYFGRKEMLLLLLYSMLSSDAETFKSFLLIKDWH